MRGLRRETRNRTASKESHVMLRHRLTKTATIRSALAAAALLCALALPATAAAAPAPAWRVNVYSNPTNFVPGSSAGTLTTVGELSSVPQYTIYVTNAGGAATTEAASLVDTLPAGVTPVEVTPPFGQGWSCAIAGQSVSCTIPSPVQPGNVYEVEIRVAVDAGLPEGSTVRDEAIVAGAGASSAGSVTTTVSSTPAPFDFTPGEGGFSSALLGEDGQADTVAGSHPATAIFDLGFTTVFPGNYSKGADGGVRDIGAYLPPGMVVDPSATPVKCTEVQLEGADCPDASQIGVVNTTAFVAGSPGASPDPVYNMVPPPGVASDFGFDAGGVGIFTHIDGGVHAGDYVLAADTENIPALYGNGVVGVHLYFWGDPSSAGHDYMRGTCAYEIKCPSGKREVTKQDAPLLTMPTSCPPSLTVEAAADSWAHPGDLHSRSATVRDLLGNPVSVSDCASLHFEPSLEARPTTTQADAPSGLSADLHIPQTNSLEERATAHLRKAVVRLPEGMSLNPSSANGLAGCSSAQIGIDPSTGVPNGDQPTCPEASRIGSVEVDTPLLDNALPGSVYVAAPYDNPFDSLLAIYVVVNDPISGTLIKLPGHVEADSNTGRLVTTFDNNPQLPFTDFKLNFFGGAGGVLRTPAICGAYSTTSEMTPWSAPESGPPATPSDSYPITGGCSQSESAQPNKPEFEAGAESPIAGRYTPFVVHLKREDGSQQFSKLTLNPPPGLTAKLAGTPECSDAALAAAAGRSGREEQAHPDCGEASGIGSVSVGAGAGPAPYYAKGAAYLAGPYKGAPLSMAIITPAVAGPYDLGTVVTRVALHVDPATAEITADADPVPSILQGIPLDVRSIDVSLDKPDFSRTGTSCDPFAVNGQLISTLGQGADLESRYQLGNCANLAFKPLLGLRLKGATKRAKNPKLIATLAAKDGEANLASTQVRLPRSAFLDQSHIRTVCTRVQFAAGAGGGEECPAGSIYGQAWARSPLLDYTLTGNAYLRSSNHKLPDLVLALHGPPSQPIAIEVDGRTDSVKGALRNTFEAIPDAPVSFFRLVLFGGKRGLVQNSRDTCAHAYRANVVFGAQNGDQLVRKPKVRAQCRKAHKKKHKRHHRRGGGHGKR